MRPDKFTLDKDGVPTPVDDLFDWAQWMQTADRQVAKDLIGSHRVSTVFLGLDYSFEEHGPPILYETMIFGPLMVNDEYQTRYSTREQALAGHQRAIWWLKHKLRLTNQRLHLGPS